MGYYLQAPTHHNKARHLITKFGGSVVSGPSASMGTCEVCFDKMWGEDEARTD